MILVGTLLVAKEVDHTVAEISRTVRGLGGKTMFLLVEVRVPSKNGCFSHQRSIQCIFYEIRQISDSASERCSSLYYLDSHQ